MTSTKTHIFITGATGYIGGTLLKRLLQHENASSFEISTLVRAADKAEKLKALGVQVITGSYSDEDLLEKGAQKADIVFQNVDIGDVGATKVILRGLKKRFNETGRPPVVIHTSGTAAVCDSANGMYESKVVYSDMETDRIQSPDLILPHRLVNAVLLDADKEGYIRSQIIYPSTIWGLATGPLVDAGIQNPHSIQIPPFIRVSIDRGKALKIGEGRNIWPNAHIEDMADLYMLVFNKVLSNPEAPHGRDALYFAAADEHKLIDVYSTIAKSLYELGKVNSPELTQLADDEVIKYYGNPMFVTSVNGGNSRCRADRSFALGWKPTRGTKDMLDSIKPECEVIVSQLQRNLGKPVTARPR
ncbi:NAD(P)-binding protein [Neolentinus lepideus HHB14362 ss-1]|uniref:NAD(P)-binding protein n=1 Tax=Neolentinus lepideus HHB14362 ss-1 TaxID=1314782 RepID=A0A165U3Q5_9AGAM|nr:NAD(P)-binding protein [Neolentinus lepideus HHB14362 ss-1]